MKLILWLCKILKIYTFLDAERLTILSRHSVKRCEKRLSYETLLAMATDGALKLGRPSIHFDYQKSQLHEYARLYQGYIFVFNKDRDVLLTIYKSENPVDLLVTRK